MDLSKYVMYYAALKGDKRVHLVQREYSLEEKEFISQCLMSIGI
jgi:hypothetical protein